MSSGRHEILRTERLDLVPISLDLVEAVLRRDRVEAERLAGAALPDEWPGPALIERAFAYDVAAVRCNPDVRLWGDRLMITRDGPRRVVGSVIFHGLPGADGVAEVGYGVEGDSQGRGYATEATLRSVEWALSQPGCHLVTATTFALHLASLRVIEKVGMVRIGTRDHELLGELLVFGRSRPEVGLPAPRLVEAPRP